MFRSNVFKIKFFELSDIWSSNLIKVSSYSCIKNAYLFFWWHWNVLFLFQKLSKLFSSVKKFLGGCIKIWTKLCESSDFSVLGKFKFHWTWYLLHSFDLSSRSYSWYRKTYVNCWSDTFIKEFSFQENLSISDRNNVCWNISWQITCLSFNNWKSSQWSSSKSII